MNNNPEISKITKSDIQSICFSQDCLIVTLNTGKVARLMFADFTLLRSASVATLKDFMCDECGFRWQALDEDISYDSIFYPTEFPLCYR